MGASLAEVLPEIRRLCVLTLLYGGLACIGTHLVIGRELRGRQRSDETRSDSSSPSAAEVHDAENPGVSL